MSAATNTLLTTERLEARAAHALVGELPCWGLGVEKYWPEYGIGRFAFTPEEKELLGGEDAAKDFGVRCWSENIFGKPIGYKYLQDEKIQKARDAQEADIRKQIRGKSWDDALTLAFQNFNNYYKGDETNVNRGFSVDDVSQWLLVEGFSPPAPSSTTVGAVTYTPVPVAPITSLVVQSPTASSQSQSTLDWQKGPSPKQRTHTPPSPQGGLTTTQMYLGVGVVAAILLFSGNLKK